MKASDRPVGKYLFCEGVAASGRGKWHLRRVGPKGPKYGGGIDTESLCGHLDPAKPFGGGWDIPWRNALNGQPAQEDIMDITCPRCLAVYSETNQ